ncbi:MAG: tetratricopeptide repeat protein [Dehalococcoidia bacterium]|nr:tetratricopeptide repeat protein [Dehalococcoidia bacterium]
MTLYQAEYRSRVRREKSKEAIAMAMENRWEEAAAINRSIIELFPDDIEAHNRLGKALFEQGKYAEARSAFAKALQLSPSNGIARKNLERLSLLKKEEQRPKKATKLGPEHFLEERGKAGTVVLEHPAGKESLAKVTAGDALTLRVSEHRLVAESVDGEYLGQVPPRLAARLVRLMQGGNQYEAAVARLSGNEVTIIMRETFQHPTQERITSFPARSDQLRPYPQTPMLDMDLLKEEEDEEIEAAFNSEWEESGEPADIHPRSAIAKEPDDEEDAEEEN